MDLLNCSTCCAQLLPKDIDVIELQTAGAHFQEMEHRCPCCHTVLLIEVTMAEDDSPTWSTLKAIAL